MTTKTKPRIISRAQLGENMFDSVLADVRALKAGKEVGRRHKVYVPPGVDVATVRAAVGLTQEAFAKRFGLSLGAIRKWERGERKPDSASCTLLAMIQVDPEGVMRLLDAVQKVLPSNGEAQAERLTSSSAR